MKRHIFIALKYFLPLVGFFLIETATHGNELFPLAFIGLFSLYLYISTKSKKAELVLFAIAALLGLVIELGITQFGRVQLWQDTMLLPVPLWLPLAWAVAGVVFYRFGKELE